MGNKLEIVILDFGDHAGGVAGSIRLGAFGTIKTYREVGASLIDLVVASSVRWHRRAA